MKLAGHTILLVILILTLALPTIAAAAGEPAATPGPEPTTLGQISERTNPTLYLMLAGACIIGAGGIAIFFRYSK